MASSQIEIILSRQLADSLSIPVFLVDTVGNLLFYNEPAEVLLGLRFEETCAMPVEEWSTIFNPKDESGVLLKPEELPLVNTLRHKEPTHGEFWIDNLKGDRYKLSVTALPIMGRPNRFLGAIALFWDSTET
jgi:PAS domain-containing protein